MRTIGVVEVMLPAVGASIEDGGLYNLTIPWGDNHTLVLSGVSPDFLQLLQLAITKARILPLPSSAALAPRVSEIDERLMKARDDYRAGFAPGKTGEPAKTVDLAAEAARIDQGE